MVNPEAPASNRSLHLPAADIRDEAFDELAKLSRMEASASSPFASISVPAREMSRRPPDQRPAPTVRKAGSQAFCDGTVPNPPGDAPAMATGLPPKTRGISAGGRESQSIAPPDGGSSAVSAHRSSSIWDLRRVQSGFCVRPIRTKGRNHGKLYARSRLTPAWLARVEAQLVECEETTSGVTTRVFGRLRCENPTTCNC